MTSPAPTPACVSPPGRVPPRVQARRAWGVDYLWISHRLRSIRHVRRNRIYFQALGYSNALFITLLKYKTSCMTLSALRYSCVCPRGRGGAHCELSAPGAAPLGLAMLCGATLATILVLGEEMVKLISRGHVLECPDLGICELLSFSDLFKVTLAIQHFMPLAVGFLVLLLRCRRGGQTLRRQRRRRKSLDSALPTPQRIQMELTPHHLIDLSGSGQSGIQCDGSHKLYSYQLYSSSISHQNTDGKTSLHFHIRPGN